MNVHRVQELFRKVDDLFITTIALKRQLNFAERELMISLEIINRKGLSFMRDKITIIYSFFFISKGCIFNE